MEKTEIFFKETPKTNRYEGFCIGCGFKVHSKKGLSVPTVKPNGYISYKAMHVSCYDQSKLINNVMNNSGKVTWMRANPMREVRNINKHKNRFNAETGWFEYCNPSTNEWIEDTTDLGEYTPYTVIPAKTIKIDGKHFREGDVYTGATCEIIGCHVELIPGEDLTHWDYKILHIPDELADKPKEPKTLTFDELGKAEEFWFLHPIFKSPIMVDSFSFSTYYALKAHVENGGNIYASKPDAELGKAWGWK